MFPSVKPVGKKINIDKFKKLQEWKIGWLPFIFHYFTFFSPPLTIWVLQHNKFVFMMFCVWLS